VAATPITDGLDVLLDWMPAILTRHRADGVVEWVAHANTTDSLTDQFFGLAAIEGGGVVAGIWPDATVSSPAPAGLQWYDAEGSLTASWRPSAEETGGLLRSISSFRPLPDGGVFWVGRAGLYNASTVAGLLGADRQIQWIVPLPGPPEANVTGHPEVALTADGGFVVLASYEPEQPEWPEEEPDFPLPPEAHVVGLGPDGAERWRTQLVGVDRGTGIRVASSGNLIVTGIFDGSMSVGDLVLEGASYPPPQFVAEIDPAGEARRLHAIELPAWLVDAGSHFKLQAMTVAGEDVVIAGEYFHDAGGPLALTGFLSTTHRLDGTLVSDTVFARQDEQGVEAGGTGPLVIDVAPDGRVATGGLYSGAVDFGDGIVDSGVNEDGFSLGKPFITVFEQSDSEVD
jgi:hypothetical protein